MVSSADFQKGTPVLRVQGSTFSNSVRWVLWPVIAWRVLAPVPRDHRVNVLQRAVLGLARGGIVAIHEMASRLRLSPDLVALIVQELLGLKFLNRQGELTPQGRTVLEEIEGEPPVDMRVGHVVADAFTGKLWPRFMVGDLPIVDTVPDDGGWPIMVSGSIGKPWEDRTRTVLPRQDAIVRQPEPREILEAARRHRRQRHLLDLSDGQGVPRMNQVSFIDDMPRPHFFALCVRRHSAGEWTVDDPFGHGESFEHRERIEQRLDGDPSLRLWLAPLVGTVDGQATLTTLQVDARWKVDERLTIAMRQQERLYELTVAMQRALLEAQSPGAPADKWDDVLVKAQRAIERCLAAVNTQFRDRRSPAFSKLLKDDDVFNREYLNRLAKRLKFDAPLPANLVGVRRGKVQSAEQSTAGSLRPLLLVAMLHAEIAEHHPLRTAAASAPSLLHQLDALATGRDRAAHDSGSSEWHQLVETHVETTFKTIELLARPQ
jgi:hypothetical protein